MPTMKSDRAALWDLILASLEVLDCLNRTIPEEPLVGACEPVSVQYMAAAGGFKNNLVHVVSCVGQNGI